MLLLNKVGTQGGGGGSAGSTNPIDFSKEHTSKPTNPIVPNQKCAIYLRVSTDEQDPENQLQACARRATELNLYVVGVYREHASAWKKGNKREEFERVLDLCKAGKIKHVIAWDVDRLHRNRKRFIEMIRGYARLDVRFHTVNQRYLETLYQAPPPFDEMFMDFILNWEGWRAQEESEKRSRRVQAAYKNRKKKWGRPKTSPYLRKKILELHGKGMSLREISRQVKAGYGTIQRIVHQGRKTNYERKQE